MPKKPVMGIVYILHFERHFRHARHYIGWTSNLDDRLAAHASGRGARLIEVIMQAGIHWTLARTWEGDRRLERKLKKRKNSAKLCPICKALALTPKGASA